MKPSTSITAPKNKPRKRIGRLKTAQDVAKYVARCIKLAERQGEGAENKYYKQVMMASILLRAVEASSFEERISQLEKARGGTFR
jgi:hypothetical protein